MKKTPLFSLLLVLLAPAAWAQNASLSGVITDADNGEPLIGATVVLRAVGIAGVVGGNPTDVAGRYSIPIIPRGVYALTVRFTGYQEKRLVIRLAAGEARTLNIALEQKGFELGVVVVSASRQQEKVLDAPASISVLDIEDIEREVAPSASSMLRLTPGLDLTKTGIDRSVIVLRGFMDAFSGATYVLTDNREAAVPSLGVNVYSIMPALPVDLERVEIVRGPGSALYGPGVDAGVIHFLSKDPFIFPGTTVSVLGGERNLFSGALRQAGVLGDRWGYKVTGTYARADDWQLDPADPLDQAQLDDDVVARNYAYEKANVNGLLKYQMGERTSLTINGGFSSLTGIILSGIGTVQADGFGYLYGQARLHAGGFFAQAYFNKNSSGNSFVYGTGIPVVDNSSQVNAQVQYNFASPSERLRYSAGADLEVTTPDTDKTIYGRNEDRAQITEIGAYGQTSATLAPRIELTVAARGDFNNLVDQFQLSPRVALVVRPALGHTVRVSYNRAFSSPASNSLFLDITAQNVPFAGTPFGLAFQGRGSVNGFTFNAFRGNNTALFSLPVPGVFGQAVPVDAIPLQPVYEAAAAQFGSVLLSSEPLPAPLTGLQPSQRALLAQFLGALTPFVQGNTAGVLGLPDDSEQGFRIVDGPVNIAPLKQTTSQVFEVGYKGNFVDRVQWTVDAYYATKKNFVGPLIVESPLVFMPNVETDLAGALTPVLVGAAQNDPNVGALLAGLNLTADQAAGLVASLAGAGLADTPVAFVQPDQQVLPTDDPNTVAGLLSYRNFGNISYWGLDASMQILATNQLNLFGNLSVVSDDFFDNEELDETDTALSLALNAPAFKFKGGFSYRQFQGFSVNAAVRYVEGFPVRSGPYVGAVEPYTLLDVGAGYDFSQMLPGLRLDVTVQNVLNDDHREFVGAPKLGRIAMGRLTYTIDR